MIRKPILVEKEHAQGGNGTAYASSKTGYTYFRIDTASTQGYITAA